MKIRFTLLIALLFIGIVTYSCSNDDGETPVEETSDDVGDNEEDTDDNDGEDTENDEGSSDGDSEGGDGEEGSEDDGSDEGNEEGSEDNDGSNDEDADENDDGEDTGEDSSDENEGGDNGEEGDGMSDDNGNGDSEDDGSDTGNEDEGTDDGGTGGDGEGGQGNGDMEDEGEGTEEEADTTPPTVIFETPQDNQVFQEGSNVMVLANVTDDMAVANAQLFVNGSFVRQESVTPYEWGTTNPNDTALMNLNPGSYELRVVGTDAAGNTAEDTITIVVETSMDDDNDEDDGTDGTTDDTDCSPANVVFNEANGMVAIEFEKGNFTEEWFLRTQQSGFTGDGYMVWEGTQRFSNPAFGRSTFKIRIENPGTYQFIWRSAITIGDRGSEHNDTWLRFADAADYFGEKQGSIVFPRDTGKTPNPNGSSRDGFFKIFRSGNDLSFKWQSKTSDNDGHDIFVVFDSPGVYTMDIAARSSGHAIDKFILFDTSIPMSEAIGASGNDSSESCNN